MKYYLKYFGCAMNQADAEKLAAVFQDVQIQRTERMEKADIIVLISCSVRQSAIDRIYGAFHQKKLKPGVIKILTGCVLKSDFEKLQDRFNIIVDITKIKELPKLIKKHQKYYQYCPGNNLYLETNSHSENFWEKLIPISNGCNQFCTYCAVPYTRGREVNRSASKILEEVKSLSNDVKKITLLGQTVNSYINSDKKSKVKDFAPRTQSVRDFADLLEQVAIAKPDTWITFLSPYPSKFSLKLIKVITKYDNISKHIHLPLQSGSDKILKLMNRKYTMKQFYKIVDQIYKYIPNANLTTDMILGFPGETKKDFQKSLKAVQKCKFTAIFTGLYSPRPGTVSDKIYEDEIAQKEKRARDEKITKVVMNISAQKNKKFVDSIHKVLVQSIKGNIAITKTKNNETIRVKNINQENLGKFINVQITKALDWSMEANSMGCQPDGLTKKLVVVLGPTACGKTKIGVTLAQKFNGEIISADSRQVYQGMDVGTGKDLKDYDGVPYHLIDIADPREQVTLKDWQKLAFEKIEELNVQGKLPILVGGTGLYLNSIVDGYVLEDMEFNQKIRNQLNKLSLKDLQNKLKKLDYQAFQKIDINNSRRVIRAIEMAKNGFSIIERKNKKPDLDILVLGIKFDKDIICDQIDNRLKQRIEKEKMIPEVRKLRQKGVSWKRLDDFGLEYRWVAKYLKKEINKEELFKYLSQAIHHFAKRQLTWFKKRKDIVWIKNTKEAENLVKQFLK
jgi:tRNA-2-methylthio-N6-dimethylallyladenosine synthase